MSGFGGLLLHGLAAVPICTRRSVDVHPSSCRGPGSAGFVVRLAPLDAYEALIAQLVRLLVEPIAELAPRQRQLEAIIIDQARCRVEAEATQPQDPV